MLLTKMDKVAIGVMAGIVGIASIPLNDAIDKEESKPKRVLYRIGLYAGAGLIGYTYTSRLMGDNASIGLINAVVRVTKTV
jgi:hypothetical protein